MIHKRNGRDDEMMTRCQTVKINNWLKNESDDFEGSARVVQSAVIGTFVDGSRVLPGLPLRHKYKNQPSTKISSRNNFF